MDSPKQKFFVSDDGKEKLSITKAELQAGIDSGKYGEKTLAWTKGMSEWLPLSDPSWEKHGIVLEPEPPELPTPVQAPTPSPPNPNVANPNSRTEGNPPKISGIAIASLVCGLLLLPIISIVLGHIARSQIKKSKGTVYGKGIALAGLILGYLPLIAALAFGIFTLFWFLSPDNISEEPWMESKEAFSGGDDTNQGGRHDSPSGTSSTTETNPSPAPSNILPIVEESRILYRGSENLIFLTNSLSPYSGVVQSFWPNGKKSKEFSVLEGITQGSIATWYENGQRKEDFIVRSGKVVSVKVWKPNGEKCPVSLIEEGNGVYVWYMPDGSERERIRYVDGQPWMESKEVAPETFDEIVTDGKDFHQRSNDHVTLKKIISAAVTFDNLEKRGETFGVLGCKLYKGGSLYSGWVKDVTGSGHVDDLIQIKEGLPNGLWINLYKDGKRRGEINHKNGYPSGYGVSFYENERLAQEMYFDKSNALLEDNKITSVVAWKPNGEKCPVTNVKGGNGVRVWYNEDGTEKSRETYHKGKRIETIWK